jgi:hypothetical protein
MFEFNIPIGVKTMIITDSAIFDIFRGTDKNIDRINGTVNAVTTLMRNA